MDTTPVTWRAARNGGASAGQMTRLPNGKIRHRLRNYREFDLKRF